MIHEEPLVKNAADEAQVKGASRKERRRMRQENGDLLKILDTIEGRRFLWRLLGKCGVFELSAYPGAIPTDVFLKEGRRSIGNEILISITEHAPESYLKMMNEAREARGTNERSSNNDNTDNNSGSDARDKD